MLVVLVLVSGLFAWYCVVFYYVVCAVGVVCFCWLFVWFIDFACFVFGCLLVALLFGLGFVFVIRFNWLLVLVCFVLVYLVCWFGFVNVRGWYKTQICCFWVLVVVLDFVILCCWVGYVLEGFDCFADFAVLWFRFDGSCLFDTEVVVWDWFGIF